LRRSWNDRARRRGRDRQDMALEVHRLDRLHGSRLLRRGPARFMDLHCRRGAPISRMPRELT
jgi:hypothetical protein